MMPNIILNRKLFSCILVLFSCIVLQAQNKTIDSLLTLLKNEKTDTGKVNHFNNLFFEYEYTDNIKAKEYLDNALELSEKIDYKKGLATTYIHLGWFAEDMGNYQQAIIHYQQSLKISEKLADKKSISATLGNIGVAYYNLSDFPKALDFYFKTLKIAEELGDKNKIQKQLGNIGIIYHEQGDYSKALDYYFKALKIAKELDDKYGIASDNGSIGNAYKAQAYIAISHQGYKESDSLYIKALDYYFKALKLFEELDDKTKIATQLTNIGTVYHDQKDYQKALDYYFKALKIDKELGDKNGIATNLGNIGSLFTSIKKYAEAEKYMLQALAIADSIGMLKEKIQFENSISELYMQTGNNKKALEHYIKAMKAKDSLFNEAKSREIMNFEFEKKEASIKAEQDKKDALAAADIRRQKIIIWSVISGLLLVIMFAGFIFRSLRVTRKQKQVIEIKSKETEEQKKVIEEQKKIVEEKNKDITDSINYANRIQRAILPHRRDIWAAFPQSFVLFKPKDIVSGDFYFFHKNEQSAFIAAVDCTGHGVPGAFMSMLGVSFLNEIVRKKEIMKASDILDHLRDSIIEALQQKGQTGEQKDGMDIALCAINTANFQLQFAGANNPLFIIRGKKPQGFQNIEVLGNIEEIEPDKQPVAIYENMRPFTNNVINLQKGDTIYLTSDGYQDQFGGPKNKKFKIKQLKEIFLNIADKPMLEQREILDTTFENWRGELEQIDDVTILGLKI